VVFAPKYQTPGVTVRVRIPEYYAEQIETILLRVDTLPPIKGKHVLSKFINYLNTITSNAN
jgi:hypothetical protein